MSSRYGSVERFFAMSLGRFPLLKENVKKFYQRIVYLGNKKSYNYTCLSKIQEYSIGECESFFGYYDKSPLSESGDVIFHVSQEDTSSKPLQGQKIGIALWRNSSNHAEVLTHSLAFNWQQGCRLQWVGDEHFIFNDYCLDEKILVSILFSKQENRVIARYPYPVQDVYLNEYFVTIDFSLLTRLAPDYGYPFLDSRSLRGEFGSGGIWRLNFSNPTVLVPLCSMDDIISVGGGDALNTSSHTVNHVMISPCGVRMVFIHRYYVSSKRVDRLFVLNSDGSGLRLLPSNGMVSHYCWLSSNKLLVYKRGSQGFDGYYVVSVESGIEDDFRVQLPTDLGDGHPTFSEDSGVVVIDTYPNKSRMQELYVVNLDDSTVNKLGEFYHPFSYSGVNRCDLHPRLTKKGDRVFFDSVCFGKRKLLGVNL